MNRSFYAVLISQTATNLGYSLYAMVVVLHMYHETGSTGWSATVTLVSMLSHILSGIVLPAFSDRFQPVALLKGSQIIQMSLLAVLAAVISLDYSTWNMIATFALLSVISFCNGWFSPVKSSLVRAVVPESHRVKAVSLISTVDQTFLFLGWTFGGLMLSLFGKQTSLAVSFALILLSFVSLFFVKLNETVNMKSGQGLASRLTEGWRLLYRHEGLRVFLIIDLMEAWGGAIWIGAVTLSFVREALHQGEAWWGYINGAYFFGTMVGGFFVFRLSRFMKGRLTLCMIAGSSLFALITLVYSVTSNAYLALLLILLMGPASQIRELSQEIMIQNAAEPMTLTKILAARSTAMQVIFLLSIILIGSVIDTIGVRYVYLLAGSLFLVSSAYGYVMLRLRNKGASMEVEQQSETALSG